MNKTGPSCVCFVAHFRIPSHSTDKSPPLQMHWNVFFIQVSADGQRVIHCMTQSNMLWNFYLPSLFSNTHTGLLRKIFPLSEPVFADQKSFLPKLLSMFQHWFLLSYTLSLSHHIQLCCVDQFSLFRFQSTLFTQYSN